MAWMLAALAVCAPAASAASLDKLAASLHDVPAGKPVAVDVYVDGDVGTAAARLRDLGMRVTAVSRREPQRMVEGTLPGGALDDAAKLGRVSAIVAVEGTGTNVGAVTSEGDAAHQGPQARALGPNGAGVVVGIVSDSIDNFAGGVADSQATGDLPADVQVLDDDEADGVDEGRAMGEIVYDTAPGVTRMVFHTGTDGAASKATGIDELVAAGADIIVDDTFVITEPFFQDGIVSQAVDRAKAAGVTYVVSAGNRARQSWEGTYSGGGTHDFGGGDTIQTLGTWPGAVRPFVSLQWDEPWGGAVTDIDFDIVDITAGNTTLASGNSDNLATKLPSEFRSLPVAAPANHTLGIRIRRFAGTGTPFIKYIVGGVPTFTIDEHNVPTAGAIDPDASSALGAITVGAVNFATNATPEGFSSRGPAFRLFTDGGVRLGAREVRPKPDIAGADGVSTTIARFDPFFGTSAAAPSVAGVAALIKSVRPSMTPDQLAAALQDTGGTVDCAPSGPLPDLDCGYGFPLANVQVQELDKTPPGATPVLSPAAPDGQNGFYTAPVDVSWSLADAGSPIYGSTGCAPATVTTDGPVTLTCEARSLGGTFKRSVTFNRDGSPPSAPAIAGIEARSYKRGKVPSAISCTASDPTSRAARSPAAAPRSGATR